MPRWLFYSLLAVAMSGGGGLIGKLTHLEELQMTALSTIGVVAVALLLLLSPPAPAGNEPALRDGLRRRWRSRASAKAS